MPPGGHNHKCDFRTVNTGTPALVDAAHRYGLGAMVLEWGRRRKVANRDVACGFKLWPFFARNGCDRFCACEPPPLLSWAEVSGSPGWLVSSRTPDHGSLLSAVLFEGLCVSLVFFCVSGGLLFWASKKVVLLLSSSPPGATPLWPGAIGCPRDSRFRLRRDQLCSTSLIACAPTSSKMVSGEPGLEPFLRDAD